MARLLRLHADLSRVMKCMCVYRTYLSQAEDTGHEKLHEIRLIILFACQGKHVLTNKGQIRCNCN